MKLIRKGKVKNVYDLGNRLLFEFTDNISVFDKIIPSKIPSKGRILCNTAAFWFGKLYESNIKNHFFKCEDSTMEVRKFSIVSRGDTEMTDYLIPLEFITRHYLAGSLYERIKSGAMSYKELGFSAKPEYGAKLPEPVFEVTTKFEAYDRKVGTEEALEIGGITRAELDEIRELIFKIDMIIDVEVGKRNLIHVDGKKELALGQEREIYVVDTFGTMDEDRWWDKGKYENGEIVQLSKEFVRQYYKEIGYYDKLKHARENNEREPNIPPLPPTLISDVERLYKDMFTRITGATL